MKYFFEWDQNKAISNVKKHGISFERASGIFKDPRAISIFDEVHSKEEERWITIGIDTNGILLLIIHTFTEKDNENFIIRIISARKATRKEIIQYERN
jgi:uncharacterized protein